MTTTSPARTGVSPARSPSLPPRLPSPPPIPEVQYGPQSPTVGEQNFQLGDTTTPDVGAARRIRPGTKAADMASGPPLIALDKLDSPFQLQEHVTALYHHHTRSPDGRHTIPITKETAKIIATPPEMADGESFDKNLWLYELCRFSVKKCNSLVVAFFGDKPACSADTCPEMRASEWQYLCAVHDPPKSCAAIDYCCHTLDWACNVLTSIKHFPSRLPLGGEGTNVSQSMRHLVNIFRRVYRIFAHGWYQHREMFWQVEGKYGIYILFKTICDQYSLIPEDNYTIPAEAEGSREDQEETPISGDAPDLSSKMTILKKPSEESLVHEEGVLEPRHDESATTTVSVGATTRRHKHTPSTGSHVSTIAEGAEEDETVAEEGVGRMSISMPAFEMRAPEDPTPTGHDVDPFAATGAEPIEGGEETGLEEPAMAKQEQVEAKPTAEEEKEQGGEEKKKEEGAGAEEGGEPGEVEGDLEPIGELVREPVEISVVSKEENKEE